VFVQSALQQGDALGREDLLIKLIEQVLFGKFNVTANAVRRGGVPAEAARR
jgi:hypothetical protein